MPGVPNAFEACVFTFGIAQAGGAGKVLAEWVTEGQTEWDMWSCDPRRFTAFAAEPDYAVAKGMEVYGHEYAIQFPAPRLAGRRATASCRRSTTASRRSARSSTPIMAGSARPGTPSRATTRRRKARRPSGATARGKSASARNAWRCATPPAFSTCPASRASACRARARATWLSTMITGIVPKPGTHRPRLFRRRQGPHRHRNVDHGARRGLLLPDHGGGRRNGTTSSGCRSICRKALELTLENATESLHLPDPCRAEGAGNPRRGLRRRPVAAVAVAPVDARSPGAGASSCASPSPANSAGKSTPRSSDTADDLRRRLGSRPEARAEAVRHVRAGFAAAGKRLPRLEGRPFDRLHGPAGRARALRQMGQAGFHAARRRCRARSSRA